MAATYTPGSGLALDRVRLLIPDKDITGLTPASGVYTLTTYRFSDEELADLLTLASDDPYIAAALALESLISTTAQAGGKVSGYSFTIDATAGFDAMRSRAAWLRSQASSTSVFTFIDAVYDATTSDEYASPPDYWP